MPVLDIFTLITSGLACFIFVGFTSFFIIPDILATIVFLLPKTFRHISQKQVESTIFVALIKQPLAIELITCGLILLAFLVDPQTGMYLVASPTSLVCWALAIPVVLWTLFKKHDDYLDAYYTGLYMEYLTKPERLAYQEMIERVESYSAADAQKVLENNGLSYLERKALNKRLLILEFSNHQAIQNFRNRL